MGFRVGLMSDGVSAESCGSRLGSRLLTLTTVLGIVIVPIVYLGMILGGVDAANPKAKSLLGWNGPDTNNRIIMRGNIRTSRDKLPEFSEAGELQPFTMWCQKQPRLLYVQLRERAVMCDGATVLKYASDPGRSVEVADIDEATGAWVSPFLLLDEMQSLEEIQSRVRRTAMTVSSAMGPDGKKKNILKFVPLRSGRPSSFRTLQSDGNTREYVVDDETGLLESARVSTRAGTEDVLLLEITSVDYNAPRQVFEELMAEWESQAGTDKLITVGSM